MRRQTEILEAGGKIAQETRGWSDEQGVTVSQRSKEYAHDYRYFPEPDLPPLTFTPEQVAEVLAQLPELPAARRDRLMAAYGLSRDDAELLVQTRPGADYFESAVAAAGAGNAKPLANLLINDVLKEVPEDTSIADLPLTPAHLVALLALVDEKVIGISQARALVPDIVRTGQDPRQLVAERDLGQISDASALEQVVAEVIAGNPKIVADYRGGKAAALKGLIGPVMRATRGKANAQIVEELLHKQLDH